MDTCTEKLVACLRHKIGETRDAEQPYFVALIGSYSSGFQRPDSDRDILVILDEDTTLPTFSVRKYESLNKIVGSLTDDFPHYSMLVVPSFVLEDHSVAMSEGLRRKQPLLLHLLVYPSVYYLMNWEHAMVVQGFGKSLLPDGVIWGNLESVRVKLKAATPRFEDVYAYLLNIFQNGDLYYRSMRRLDLDFALRFGLHRLLYCAKHLAAHKLNGGNLDWGEIFKRAEKLGPKGQKLFGEIRKIRHDQRGRPQYNCLPNELDQLYAECWDFF